MQRIHTRNSELTEPAINREQRKRRRIPVWISSVLAAAFVLSLGWTVFWFIAASSTRNAIEVWLSAERDAGRNWDCAERSISGFPTRISLLCKEPTLAARINGKALRGAVGTIVAFANLYEPDKIFASIASPFDAIQEGGGKAHLAWDEASLVVSDPGSPEIKLAIAMSAAKGQLVAADRAFELFVQHLTFAVSPKDVGDGSSLNVRFDVGAKGIVSDQLNKALGEATPSDFETSAIVSKLPTSNIRNFPQALEVWRKSGGSIDIGAIHFNKGSLLIAAKGQLGLDEAHRISGGLDVEASGLAPLLPRLGLPPSAIAIGSLIDRFLPGRVSGADGAKPLRLPVAFRNGRISVAAFQTPWILPPLY